MPTCGFIRVQPDGMKQKDIGNSQRYDPVSKRMITIYNRLPPISEVTLISISQPAFVDPVFLSDYTVSFRAYTGCLTYGNDAICSVYDQTDLQVATSAAKLVNGVITLVLKGQHTPGVSGYYATVTYGSTTINSTPTQLLPEFPAVSSLSATIYPDHFERLTDNSGLYSLFSIIM